MSIPVIALGENLITMFALYFLSILKWCYIQVKQNSMYDVKIVEKITSKNVVLTVLLSNVY